MCTPCDWIRSPSRGDGGGQRCDEEEEVGAGAEKEQEFTVASLLLELCSRRRFSVLPLWASEALWGDRSGCAAAAAVREGGGGGWEGGRQERRCRWRASETRSLSLRALFSDLSSFCLIFCYCNVQRVKWAVCDQSKHRRWFFFKLYLWFKTNKNIYGKYLLWGRFSLSLFLSSSLPIKSSVRCCITGR